MILPLNNYKVQKGFINMYHVLLTRKSSNLRSSELCIKIRSFLISLLFINYYVNYLKMIKIYVRTTPRSELLKNKIIFDINIIYHVIDKIKQELKLLHTLACAFHHLNIEPSLYILYLICIPRVLELL